MIKFNSAYSPVNIYTNQRLMPKKIQIKLASKGKRLIRDDLIITKLLRKNI